MELRTALVAKTMPRTSTRMPPALPIRLITALAFERRGLIVTSGISATAGERNVAMEISAMSRSAIKMTNVPLCSEEMRRTTAFLAGTTYFV